MTSAKRMVVVGLAALLVRASVSNAEPVRYKLGTATGGIAVYYNSGDENPLNLAYFRAQAYNSVTDVRGAGFAFSTEEIDPNYPGITPAAVFGDHGQFRFDLIMAHSTCTIPVPELVGVDRTPAPTYAYDPTSLGAMLAAVSGYQGAGVVNTLVVGQDGIGSVGYESLGDANWKATFSGSLLTDGTVRWYTEGVGDTSFTALGISPWIEFSGDLYYWRANDTTVGMDFYEGSIDFYVVPEPMTLSLLGLGILALVRRSR
ncbi:MAG: PEP-CTERM sorting domain-containing protein [Phycisphaerae bacterium]|nr:PEP-CTERM sorting domain-containing protein [Phycisphaerae bacterium]